MSCGLAAVFSNCKSGPAEILSDRFEEVNGVQEIREERYGILIPVMDDKKNLDPSVITEEEERLAGLLETLLKDDRRLEYLSEQALERAAQFHDRAYRDEILRFAQNSGMEGDMEKEREKDA